MSRFPTKFVNPLDYLPRFGNPSLNLSRGAEVSGEFNLSAID
jgi:hypothetical protein